ncbi:hypothetical protein PYW07_011318 [Mythimna separata]|uniref:Uncharacterized protein n=1 Tax=Mythimna separata TaxID=271217 RepID=A0AAD8DM17_MYTSE|nr:hypothetical protein PYW07_011318 [Mythimna separata]
MSIVLKTGFVSVTHNIKFQPQTVFKGKLLVLAGHVRDVEELRTKQGQSSIIHALIIRQTSINSFDGSYPFLALFKFPSSSWESVKLAFTISASILAVYNTTTTVTHFC